MIHLIVFFIKIIVKAINGNKSNVPVTGSNTFNSNSTHSNFSNMSSPNVPHSSVTVSNKNKKTDDEKMLYAFLLTVFTSCCCSVGFLANIILAFITKKVPHMIATIIIAVLLGVSFYFFIQEDKKKNNVEITNYATVEFNDTIRFSGLDPELARKEFKSYFNHKYASWIKDTNEESSSLNIDMMTYSLFGHKFDTIYVDNELKTDVTIDEILYLGVDAVEDNTEDVIEDELSESKNDKVEEAIVEDRSETQKEIVIYLQEKDRESISQDEEDLKSGKYNKKKDNLNKAKDNIYIVPIIILILISFVYSFYLWYSFFNKDKDANKDLIDSMNDTRSKPTITFGNKTTTSSTTSSDNYQTKKTTDYLNPPASIPNKPNEPKIPNMAKGTDHSGKKIAINSVDVYNLMTIPTLNYSQALLIITERTNNGPYSSIDDIKSRNSLADNIVSEISKYVYID